MPERLKSLALLTYPPQNAAGHSGFAGLACLVISWNLQWTPAGHYTADLRLLRTVARRSESGVLLGPKTAGYWPICAHEG